MSSPVQPGYVKCAKCEFCKTGGFPDEQVGCSLHWLSLVTVLQGMFLCYRNRGEEMKDQKFLFILIYLTSVVIHCLIVSLSNDDYVSKYSAAIKIRNCFSIVPVTS